MCLWSAKINKWEYILWMYFDVCWALFINFYTYLHTNSQTFLFSCSFPQVLVKSVTRITVRFGWNVYTYLHHKLILNSSLHVAQIPMIKFYSNNSHVLVITIGLPVPARIRCIWTTMSINTIFKQKAVKPWRMESTVTIFRVLRGFNDRTFYIKIIEEALVN